MTDRQSNDKGSQAWESQVNALLDGELDNDAAEALKLAAADDHTLARLIIEAWQLQQGIESLGIERAPAQLSKKLLRIPAEERAGFGDRSWYTGFWRGPNSALSFAGVAALAAVLAVGLMVMRPWEPSMTEIEQARADLKAAFEHLDRISNRTGEEIDSLVATELRSGVTGAIARHLPQAGSRDQSHGKPWAMPQTVTPTLPAAQQNTEPTPLEDES